MRPEEHVACSTICKAIKKASAYAPFKFSLEDYKSTNLYTTRVENIMVFSEIDQHVKNNLYPSAAEFVRDMRRLSGNCLRFCLEGENLSYRKKARDLIKMVDDRMEQDLGVGAVPRVSDDTMRCLDILDYLLAGNVTILGFWARIEVVLGEPLWQEYQAQVEYPCDFGRLTSQLLEDGLAPELFLGRAEVICTNAVQFWSARNMLPDVVAAAQTLHAKLTTRAQADFPIAWRDRKLVEARPPPLLMPPAALPKPLARTGPPLVLTRNDSMPAQPPSLMGPSSSTSRVSFGGGMRIRLPGAQTTLTPLQDAAAPVAPARAPSPGGVQRLPTLGGSEDAAGPAKPFKGFKIKVRQSAIGGGGSMVGGKGAGDDGGSVLGAPSEDDMDVSADSQPPPPPPLRTVPSIDLAAAAGGGGGGGGIALPPARKPEKPPLGVFDRKRPAAEVKDEQQPLNKKPKTTITIKNHPPQPSIAIAPPASTLPRAPPPPQQGAADRKTFRLVNRAAEPAPAKVEDKDSDDDVPLAETLKQPVKPQPSKPPKKPRRGDNRPKREKGKGGKGGGGGGGQQPAISVMPSIDTAPAISVAQPAAPLPTDPASAPITKFNPKPREARGPSSFSESWEEAAKVIVDKIWKHKWVQPPKRIDLSKYPPNHKYHTMLPPTTRYCFDEPVLERYPFIRDAYMAKVDKPIDVATVRKNLEEHVYADADEFLADLDRVFVNCLTFNAAEENYFEREVCEAARHLRLYLDALAAEYLKPRPGEVYEDKLYNRAFERQQKLRQEREAALRSRVLKQVEPFKYFHSQMTAFVKSLKTERPIADTLLEKVPDHITIYYQTIERPMWLRAVMSNLDERPRVGDIIDQLYLIAQNALAFNTAPADKGDKVSQRCVEAAKLLERHLHDRLPKVLLDMWEHERRVPVQERLDKYKLAADGGPKARLSADSGSLDNLFKDGGGGRGAGVASKGPRGRVAGKQPGQGDKAGKPRKDENRLLMDKKEKENRKAQEKHTKEEVIEEVWAAMHRRKQQLLKPPQPAAPAPPPSEPPVQANGALPSPTKPTKILLRVTRPEEPSPQVKKPVEVVASPEAPAVVVAAEEPQPMEVVKPEEEEAAKEAVAGPVLTDFFPVLTRKKKRPGQDEDGRWKQGRAVLEELLGGVNNTLRRGLGEEEEAVVKQLKAQVATAPAAAAEEEGEKAEGMEVDVEGQEEDDEEDAPEVQVLVRRVEPPCWQAGEWEGGLASLAFPSCPLVDLTVMVRGPRHHAATPPSASSLPRPRLFVNGERVEADGGRASSALRGPASSALGLELQGVPINFRFAKAGQARAASLETLQEEVRSLGLQASLGAGAWGEVGAGSARYRDRMLGAYSWLSSRQLDFSEQGQFYMSRHVGTETRAGDGRGQEKQQEAWKVVHVVADAAGVEVRIGQRCVYPLASSS